MLPYTNVVKIDSYIHNNDSIIVYLNDKNEVYIEAVKVHENIDDIYISDKFLIHYGDQLFCCKLDTTTYY